MTWEVGDLAMCIKAGRLTRTGALYTVKDVSRVGDEHEGFMHYPEDPDDCLRFVGVPHKLGGWSNSKRFIKVTPEDLEETESIGELV